MSATKRGDDLYFSFDGKTVREARVDSVGRRWIHASFGGFSVFLVDKKTMRGKDGGALFFADSQEIVDDLKKRSLLNQMRLQFSGGEIRNRLSSMTLGQVEMLDDYLRWRDDLRLVTEAHLRELYAASFLAAVSPLSEEAHKRSEDARKAVGI